mmetsp:Transcript_81754/g.240001  ORF Transcript_81754/g.240001 Transcript_81754/m.240001 type:complete len:252 (-) Transcript_81754:639-1394(-)
MAAPELRGLVPNNLQQDVGDRESACDGHLEHDGEEAHKDALTSLARPQLILIDHVWQHAVRDEVRNRQAGTDEATEAQGSCLCRDKVDGANCYHKDTPTDEVGMSLVQAASDPDPKGNHEEARALDAEHDPHDDVSIMQPVLAEHQQVGLHEHDRCRAAQVRTGHTEEAFVRQDSAQLLEDPHALARLLTCVKALADASKGNPCARAQDHRKDRSAHAVALLVALLRLSRRQPDDLAMGKCRSKAEEVGNA